MISNWVITTQAVKHETKGIIARERYLLNHNHPNHKNTDDIVSLVGSAETSRRIALEGERFRLKQKLQSSKGGRPLKSFAMEFCLTIPKTYRLSNLPKGYRPSNEQWRAIIRDCCAALATKLGLSAEEKKQFAKQIRAVCHKQNQSTKSGSGDHVHIIIGKVVAGRVLKELQKKEATKVIKIAFNAAVLSHLGIDNRDYQPYELNRGKRLESWRFHHQKVQESLEVENLIKKMQKQADKWFEAHNSNDTKQLNRQFNRLTKTFKQLSERSLTETTQKKINSIKNNIENKNRKKFNP